MGERLEQERRKELFMEGLKAFKPNVKSCDVCPYILLTGDSHEWTRGWVRAQEDYKTVRDTFKKPEKIEEVNEQIEELKERIYELESKLDSVIATLGNYNIVI